MKKVLLFGIIASSFSFTSCKKDHICTCTDNVPGWGPETTKITLHNTKKKATTTCKSYEFTSGTEVQTCSLD